MTQLNHQATWGRLTNHLSAGVDYTWQAIDETKYPNLGGAVEGPDRVADQTLTQTGAGVFVLDRLEIGPHWGISGSARYDRITNRLADHLRSGGVDLSGDVAYRRATGRLGRSTLPSRAETAVPPFSSYW